MRKLIVQQWISADGFATDSHGTTSFFESPKYNEGWQQDELELFKNIDLIILGANTYKMFVDYWPDAKPEDEAVAPFINSTKKAGLLTFATQSSLGKLETRRSSGRHFLPDDEEWNDMELISSKAYPSGVVCIVYKPRAK
ncbi:hypothetical protein COLO4_01681 [Corchorus olitorius]|uniref:Bacterial bifunctional deaminase-reductase C-terminal domain-containing protein n=1 Tax=Corchorus olitorius TaxID=93759 RepID=A0A1R3L281_9ROSI|nr:hypothetical protein COLO4_01681 [Corchorus olitorius]